MAERRKIVIQTGEGADEPLPTPHFDTEATLTARPVVPLTEQETPRMPYGDYAGRAQKPFWKRPALLVAIVLAAIGVGVAAGFAIGVYRNRNAAETPTATAPAPAVENTDLGQMVEPVPTPTPERVATVTEQPEEEPVVEPKEEERERTTARNERKDNDDEVRAPVVAKPSVVRDKKPIKVDEYTIENERAERQAEKEQRREERRAERRERRRRRDDEAISLPRGIQRAGREVDRIREIFEGRQP